jgi:hypothetical protein
MDTVTPTDRKIEHENKANLALQAMNRAVRQAFLNGEAYDPDGSGKAFWLRHDEFGNPIEETKSG